MMVTGRLPGWQQTFVDDPDGHVVEVH